MRFDSKDERAWVVVGLTQSVDYDNLSVAMGVEVYAVAATLQAAKDILWDLRPSSDNLSVTIVETTLIDR